MTVSSSYRIGTLSVCVPRCPHPRLEGLCRLPAASPGQATLDLEIVERASWEPGLERGGEQFVKSLAMHQCRIDFPNRRVSLRIVAGLDDTGWYFVFRDIFSALCGLSQDALLHASAVVHQGEATAFCAYSGGGKSTIAHLLGGEDGTVNDEINWVFRDAGGQFRLVDQRFYRLPSGADQPDLPLAGIFLLVQAPACLVSSIQPENAYPIVLAAPYGNDPNLPLRAATAAALFQAIPVRQLAFNLRPDEIRAALGWASHA
jgi:hypothetical protein